MVDFLNRWKEGLARTRKVAFGRIATIFGATEITDETWDELETTLIQADVGLETTQSIIVGLKKRVTTDGLTSTD
jgi:fused signal recognition particle receptor